MHAVTLYLVDQAYGGPEEGGWWYQCGEPHNQGLHPLNRVFNSLSAARTYCHSKKVADYLAQLNSGRREIDSVLSEGQFNMIVGGKDEVPAPYPQERPHYE